MPGEDDILPPQEPGSPSQPRRPSLVARFWHGTRRIGLLRLVLFFVLLVIAGFGAKGILNGHVLPNIPAALRNWVGLGANLVICVFMISVYALLVGIFERRDILELSIKRGARLWACGLALAVAMFCLIYAVFLGLGTARWQGFAGTAYLLPMAVMALFSGISEELIFRGGVYRITEDMFGTGAALLISGALFGLLHLGNPHASLLAGIAIAVEAGILLGAAYAATRNLWLAIGIHMGWNFAEGGIFGASVSGLPSGQGLFRIPLAGPDWLTGGEFGPEASVVTLAICTAAGLYFVWRTMRTGRWCRAGFRMMLD
jgi:membrane protease YdiL (CAAX protease family)